MPVFGWLVFSPLEPFDLGGVDFGFLERAAAREEFGGESGVQPKAPLYGGERSGARRRVGASAPRVLFPIRGSRFTVS